MRLATSYENPGRLGLIAGFVWFLISSFHSNKKRPNFKMTTLSRSAHAEQRADLTQVASLLLGFVAGKFSDHAPNLPPKLGKTSEFFGMRLLQFVLGEPM